jgi:hypothetical protein
MINESIQDRCSAALAEVYRDLSMPDGVFSDAAKFSKWLSDSLEAAFKAGLRAGLNEARIAVSECNSSKGGDNAPA